MTISRWIISALWLLFLVYWGIGAISAKRTVKTASWWRQGALRLVMIVLILAAYRRPAIRHAVMLAEAHQAGGIIWSIAGVILAGLGISLAILARTYLGRNWGTPMSQKENPELVSGGPYALIRHPIYSGIILAMFGSILGLGLGLLWLLPLVLFSAYFIYSARREEELMCRQFPEAYPAYMRRTKMLVPFLL